MINKKIKNTSILIITLAIILCMILPGCAKKVKVITNINDFDIAYNTSRLIKFEIVMESGAVIEGELYPLVAPITVRNFVTLAESGYYNGTVFGYVKEEKIIQCGGTGEPAPYTIFGEFLSNGWSNTLSHLRGTLSMTHKTGENDSAYSTFFILLEDRTYYDGEYASFGKITSGLLSCDAISRAEAENGIPVEPQVIKAINILGN